MSALGLGACLVSLTGPRHSLRFSKELSTAFGLLNLKNDNLRKRFDGIKYDVKKLEESGSTPRSLFGFLLTPLVSPSRLRLVPARSPADSDHGCQ